MPRSPSPSQRRHNLLITCAQAPDLPARLAIHLARFAAAGNGPDTLDRRGLASALAARPDLPAAASTALRDGSDRAAAAWITAPTRSVADLVAILDATAGQRRSAMFVQGIANQLGQDRFGPADRAAVAAALVRTGVPSLTGIAIPHLPADEAVSAILALPADVTLSGDVRTAAAVRLAALGDAGVAALVRFVTSRDRTSSDMLSAVTSTVLERLDPSVAVAAADAVTLLETAVDVPATRRRALAGADRDIVTHLLARTGLARPVRVAVIAMGSRVDPPLVTVDGAVPIDALVRVVTDLSAGPAAVHHLPDVPLGDAVAAILDRAVATNELDDPAIRCLATVTAVRPGLFRSALGRLDQVVADAVVDAVDRRSPTRGIRPTATVGLEATWRSASASTVAAAVDDVVGDDPDTLEFLLGMLDRDAVATAADAIAVTAALR